MILYTDLNSLAQNSIRGGEEITFWLSVALRPQKP